MATVFIGFGSNAGDRFDYCDRAVTLLGLLPFSRVIAVSSLYETEPVRDSTDPGSGWFLNGIIQIETDLEPRRLLAICREVEQALGRDLAHRGGPRTLDLDLLFYGARVIEEPQLTVPHPRLHHRRFVLVPMVELAPDWIHPRLHRSMRDLLNALDDPSAVTRVEPRPGSRYAAVACTTSRTPRS
jgi:2-amino-4-hydroxy-6-hydroxymethyldihydropteridine diphosphokinase